MENQQEEVVPVTETKLGPREHNIKWKGEDRTLRIVWWKTEEIIKLIFAALMGLKHDPLGYIKYLSLSSDDKKSVETASNKIKNSNDKKEIEQLQEQIVSIIEKGKISTEGSISLNETVMGIITDNINRILSICLSERDKNGYTTEITIDEILYEGDPVEIIKLTELVTDEILNLLKNAPRVAEKIQMLIKQFQQQ